MAEYIRFISKITNKNFIFSQDDLDFNVSIVSEEPISVENIIAALLQELRIHNLSLIEQGNNLLIHKNPVVNSPATIVTSDRAQEEAKEQDIELITRVFQLNTLNAGSLANIIKPLLSPLAIIDPIVDTGHIVITDLTTNIDKIDQLIKSLDAPTSGFEIGQYLVQNTTADQLISLAERILSPIAGEKSLTFVPHIPTNSIFIVSTPFLVERSVAVLQHIDLSKGSTRILSLDALKILDEEKRKALGREDRPGLEGLEGFDEEELSAEQLEELRKRGISRDSLTRAPKWASDLPLGHVESTKFFIHKLKYRKGDAIAVALRNIADSMLQAESNNTELISSINSVQWLEASNSLVFTGTKNSIDKVKDLIEQIDTPLKQVFIEMLLVEVNFDDTLTFGVQYGSQFNGDGSGGRTRVFKV